MFNKLMGVIAGVALGGAFGSIGYFLYINDPIKVGGRKGRAFMEIQDWLIGTLGTSQSGLLLMGLGLVLGGYAVYTSLTDKDDE